MGAGRADPTADFEDDSGMSPTVSRPGDQPAGSSADRPEAGSTRPDPASQRWLAQLRPGHPRHDEAVVRLHEVLRRIAVHELSRRRSQLRGVSGPEFDDLAHQAADDALVNVLARLDDFRGLSRFTTWAYRFVIFEVSAKVARHAWHRQPPDLDQLSVERLVDQWASRPDEQFEQRLRLQVLAGAIGELTERQRAVFVAVGLNDVPIDVVAVELRTNRNAIYKNLFDARRSLRRKLAAAGLPIGDASPDATATTDDPRGGAAPTRSRG
jgi:RNA polymerase sigma-70 factor, ECF subfamily